MAQLLGSDFHRWITQLQVDFRRWIAQRAAQRNAAVATPTSHVARILQQIHARRSFWAQMGVALTILVVFLVQPVPREAVEVGSLNATSANATSIASSEEMHWWSYKDFVILPFPCLSFLLVGRAGSMEIRSTSCNDWCQDFWQVVFYLMLAGLLLVVPLVYFILKLCLWILLSGFLIDFFTTYLSIGLVRLQQSDVFAAAYCALVLAVWALVLLGIVDFVLPVMLKYLTRDVLERKRFAVFEAMDRWVSIYIIGFATVEVFNLAVFFCQTVFGRSSLMYRLWEVAPALVTAVMIPQVILVSFLCVGPFELRDRIADMQTHVFLCSLLGVCFAAVHLSSGRTPSFIIDVLLGALMGALVALVFFGTRRLHRCVTKYLQGQLSQAHLAREESLLAHPRRRLCTICQSSEADALNSPCGHLFLCMECAMRFQEHEGTVCNACRQPSTLANISGSAKYMSMQRPCIESGEPLELVIGLWRTAMARRQEHRAASKRLCKTCGVCPRNVVNLDCGHSLHCSVCADALRRSNGDKCPKCGIKSVLKKIVDVQRCDICFTDASSDDLLAIGACAHQICVYCAMQYVRSGLGSVADQVRPEGLRCPLMHVGCEKHLTPQTVRSFLLARQSKAEPSVQPISEDEVQRLERFVEESKIPVERRFHCVSPDCARLMSIDRTALLKQAEPKLECQFCTKMQCVRCLILWHGAMTCKEVDEQRKNVDQGAAADLHLIDATTKPCPSCGFRISHYHGHACHHIMPGRGCLNCGNHFCYSCSRIGHSCSRCSVYCKSTDILENLILEPYPKDKRCGCAICPDCRPGRGNNCPQCDGTCVVCKGIVPPGKLASKRKLNRVPKATESSNQIDWSGLISIGMFFRRMRGH